MKATGVIRKIDELGRVVVPIESRRQIGVNIKDQIEISVSENRIILTKYTHKCIFCKNDTSVIEIMGKLVCQKCIEGLRDM